MKHTCPICTRRVKRVYQYGQCRECTIEQLKSVRPLIDRYRSFENSPSLFLMAERLSHGGAA